MKNFLLKLNKIIEDNYTRIRVYLSVILCATLLYSVKDIPIFQDYMTIFTLLVLTPLVIYLFVKYLFYKKG